MSYTYRPRPHTRRIVVGVSNSETAGPALSYLRSKDRANGALDVRWHFVIHRDGALSEGRDFEAYGNILPGMNHEIVGILLILPDRTGVVPTFAQGQALYHLVRILRDVYGNIPVSSPRQAHPRLRGVQELKFNLQEIIDMHDSKTTSEDSGSPHSVPKQHELILSYLQGGRTLSNMIALTNLGVASVTSRVAELRKLGYDIKDRYKTDHFGKRYKVYYMDTGEDANSPSE